MLHVHIAKGCAQSAQLAHARLQAQVSHHWTKRAVGLWAVQCNILHRSIQSGVFPLLDC